MKTKKLLVLLVPLLVLAMAMSANALYEPIQDKSYGLEIEDHPWGGDDGTGGGNITGKGAEIDNLFNRFVVLNFIRIIFVPTPDSETRSDGSKDDPANNILPDEFNSLNNRSQGSFGKGKN